MPGGYKEGCRYGTVVAVGGLVGLAVENGPGVWDGRGLHVNIERGREYLDDEEEVETLLLLCFGCRDSHTSLGFLFFASTWAIPEFEYISSELMLWLTPLKMALPKLQKSGASRIWNFRSIQDIQRVVYSPLNKREHLSLRLCK